MKRKILSIALALAVVLQMCTVTPIFAADGFFDDFESYEAGTKLSECGWEASQNAADRATIVTDPFTEGSSSQVMHLYIPGHDSSVSKSFEDQSGIVDISMKYGIDSANSNTGEFIRIYNGDTIIGGLHFFQHPTWWAKCISLMRPDVKYDCNTRPTDAVFSQITDKKWYYIVNRLDFNTQQMTTVISSDEITEAIMDDLQTAKANNLITAYETVDFINPANVVNKISFGSEWSGQTHNLYCDVVSSVPYKATPKYTVSFVDEAGNEVSQQLIWENSLAEEPVKPEKAGYVFDGWFLNGVLYDFSTPITADISLQAKYTKRLESLNDTIDSYDLNSQIGSYDQWKDSSNYGTVVSDPLTEDTDNRVIKVTGGYGSVTRYMPAATGIVDVSYKMSVTDVNTARGSGVILKDSSDRSIAGIAPLRIQGSYSDILTVRSADTQMVDSFVDESSIAARLVGLSAAKWHFIKYRLDFNTKKATIAVSFSPISDDDISDPENAENLLGYAVVDFIDTSAEDIAMIALQCNRWGNAATIYYDDLYVADAPNQNYIYSVKDASYNIGDDGIFNVGATITKGENNSSVIVAAYDADQELIYATVDHDTFGANTPNGSKIAYKTSFTTERAADIDSIRVFVWDVETLTPMCTATPVAYLPPVTPDPTPAPTDDPNDISDVGAVEYEFADVHRAAVPVYVEEADFQAIPENLSDKVYRTYPDGKMKAFLLSFDDGPCINDFDVLIPLFKENNLVSAFNLNMGDDMKAFNKLIHYDPETGKSEYLQDATSVAFQEKVVKQYEGHEIGNHGTNHYPDYMLNKDNYRHEVGLNKYNIETIFNTESNCYIASYKDRTPDKNPASGVWRTAYMKYLKLRYYRNAPLINNPYAQRPAELNYKVPTSFYGWNPTIRITDNNILKDVSDKNNTIYYNSPEILQYYLSKDFGNEWTLFFGWGHGTDISQYDWNAHKLSVNGNYANFKTTCELAGSNSNILWNVTPIDYVDYINASRLTSVTQDGSSVVISNPSKEIDVWMNVGGNDVVIPAGETVSITLDE